MRPGLLSGFYSTGTGKKSRTIFRDDKKSLNSCYAGITAVIFLVETGTVYVQIEQNFMLMHDCTIAAFI